MCRKSLVWCLNYFNYSIGHWLVHGKERPTGSKETKTQKDSSHTAAQLPSVGAAMSAVELAVICGTVMTPG